MTAVVYRKGKAVQVLAPPPADPFIVATGQNSIKPDASSRKFIRQHVMKGKNRKRVSSQLPGPGSWINSEQGRDTSPLQGPLMTTCLRFVEELEPYMRQFVYDFVVVMKNAMFPVEGCVDVGKAEQHWFDDLGHDPAYTQTVSTVAQSYFDAANSQSFEAALIVHMNRTIVNLHRKLSETSLNITDSIIFTVMALVMVSQVLDDLEAAEKHIHGLYQLLRLRGGIATLAHKPSLQMKCCRLDLGFALRMSSKPLLFAEDNLTWRPYLADPQKASVSKSTPMHTACGGNTPDIRLVNVWLDLREFCIAVNLAHQTQRKLSPGLFQEALISVQYRLQHLAYDVRSDNRQEVCRVAMLALTTPLIFSKEIQGVPAHGYYQHLAENLRTVLRSVLSEQQHAMDDEWLRFTLWLVFISRLSVLDAPEDFPRLGKQLIDTCEALGLNSWDETRQALKSFIWMDVVYDETGREFFSGAQDLREQTNGRFAHPQS